MQICQIKDTLKINTLPKHLKIEIQYIQKVYRINWYDSAIIPETQTNITNYTISKMQWEYTKGGEKDEERIEFWREYRIWMLSYLREL